MALTPEQLRQRENKVTGSFVPYLMAGDSTKILREWQRLVGDDSYEPENLDDVWVVQLGSYLEPFALDWYQRKSGWAMTRRGEVVAHPKRPYVCCTLDAWCAERQWPIDCKWMGHYQKVDERAAFYTPQIVVQAGCTGAERGALLVMHGSAEPAEYPLEWDAAYAAAVWDRVEEFWTAVCDLRPPVELPPLAAPVPAIREADLSRSNAWVSAAADWLESRLAAKTFVGSEKILKGLVEPDVKRAFGSGIECLRNRAGALSIREMK